MATRGKTNYQPVNIPNKTYNQIKQYATAMGQPITQVVTEMAEDWLATIGRTKLADKEKDRERFRAGLNEIVKQAKVIAFDSSSSSSAAVAGR